MARIRVMIDFDGGSYDSWVEYPEGCKPQNDDLIDANAFVPEKLYEEMCNTKGWGQTYIKLRKVHLDKIKDTGEVHWSAFGDLYG